MDIKNKEAFESKFKLNAIYERESRIRKNNILEFAETAGIYFNIVTNNAWELWQAAQAQAVPEWISVEDEFPKKNLKVLLNLVTRKNGKPIKCIGFYSIEPDEEPCFVLDDNFTELKGVTHWVRLPDSPKAQEQSHD